MRLIKRIKPLYKMLIALRTLVLGGAMRFMHFILKVDGNKAAFSSNKGKNVSDSPLAIAEALHALKPDADIVFQAVEAAAAPEWARAVKPHSFAWLREMATSKVYVDNFNRPFYQIKFGDQKYVQTWHGDRGFKKVLYDMDPDGGFPDYKYIDLAVAGSKFCEGMYRTGFRYAGEVMVTGLPRNDCLVHPLDPAEAKRRCGLNAGKKHLLYAPTFRDGDAGKPFEADIDLPAAKEALEAVTGDEWEILTRSHEQNKGVSGGFRDYTDFPDMALLMQACDMLITDYSSCAGDFLLLGRPVILYHGSYSYDRELYFDIEKSPFMIARSTEELTRLINGLTPEKAEKNCRETLEFFGTNETGHASIDVAKRIIGWMG